MIHVQDQKDNIVEANIAASASRTEFGLINTDLTDAFGICLFWKQHHGADDGGVNSAVVATSDLFVSWTAKEATTKREV